MVEPQRGWQRVLERAQALCLLHAVAQHAGWSDEEIDVRTAHAIATPAATAASLRGELQQLDVDAEQYEINNLRFHDLRRTLGSWQARTGASLRVIGKSLNHKSPASTAVYARLDVDPVRAAIDKATAAMWRAAGLPEREQAAATGKILEGQPRQ